MDKSVEKLMNNIFLLPPELAEEDRFTACLHYAIDNIPELGQVIVDFLLIQSEKSSSPFIKAVNRNRSGGAPQAHPLNGYNLFD